MKISDTINESSLIENGFLPEEFPPFFTNDNFFSEWSELNITKLPKAIPFLFNIPQSNLRRRTLHIANPETYIKACKILNDNKSKIPEFKDSAVTCTSILLKKKNRNPYNQQTVRKLAGAEAAFIQSKGLIYRLSTDIVQYYPSIYTHSIPWMILGKVNAKKLYKKGKLRNTWTDDLDIAFRNMQDAETTGILVGPKLSDFIAEILMQRIDDELTKKFNKVFGKNLWSGGRFVDDMWFYFNSYENAEEALGIISTIIAEYKLEINSNKTSIEKAPFTFEPLWKTKLEELSEKDFSNPNELLHFINKASYWVKNNTKSRDNPLKYALTMINDVQGKEFWNLSKSFLLQSISIEHTCIPVIAKILVSNKTFISNEDREHIREVLSLFLKQEANMFHDYEVGWILYILKELNIIIEQPTIDFLVSTNRPAIMLSAYALYKSDSVNYNNFTLSTKIKSELSDGNSFKNESWLLSYELYKDDFSNLKFKQIPNFFKEMKKKNISFICS